MPLSAVTMHGNEEKQFNVTFRKGKKPRRQNGHKQSTLQNLQVSFVAEGTAVILPLTAMFSSTQSIL